MGKSSSLSHRVEGFAGVKHGPEHGDASARKAIRVIGKLGNRNAYEYDEDDVRKIVKALTDEIESLKNRMKTTKRGTDVEFKLK